MLDGKTFYFQSIRKNVIAFGTLFNDISIVRDDGNGNSKTIPVALSYAPREHYIATLRDKLDGVQTIYPRMSYEMVGMSFDPTRKLSTTGYYKKETTTVSDSRLYKQLNPVPYNFNFNLNVYSRTTEDGLQIIEQILPYFRPDFTVTIKEVTELDIKRDVTIVLDGIDPTDTWESSVAETRVTAWTLSFTVRGNIYPPISLSKPILTSTVNINQKLGEPPIETLTVAVDPLTAKENEVWTAVTTIT